MKVYTCTPVQFRGGDVFFSRDSGLFCKGLASIGVETRAILPGAPVEDKDPLLMRVPYSELESPIFWRSLSLDGLILYSWAAPRYYPIAKALKEANVPFLVNVDSSGLVSSLANSRLWSRHAVPILLRSLVHRNEWRSGLSSLVDNYFRIHRTAHARARTFEEATAVGAVTALGVLWLQQELKHLGRDDLVTKIVQLSHPQPDEFVYSGSAKQKIVISVARWEREDWLQKNPRLLVDSLISFLGQRAEWKALVVGRGASALPRRLKTRPCEALKRIDFVDFIPMRDLVPSYNRAMIGFWSSRGEGQIGAGAQALCFGCSVVAANTGTLSCFHDYVSRESGRLALSSNSQDMAEALSLEAKAWEDGERNPDRISRVWHAEFSVTNIARKALSLLGIATQQ